jgi:hypothetical protein
MIGRPGAGNWIQRYSFQPSAASNPRTTAIVREIRFARRAEPTWKLR